MSFFTVKKLLYTTNDLILILASYFTFQKLFFSENYGNLNEVKRCNISCPVIHENKLHEGIQSKLFRSAKYIPTKVEEQSVNRWKYFTSKHLYEMINQDPRIGLNGMWRQEVETVNKYGLQVLKEKNINDFAMTEMFRYQDPFAGVKYIIIYQSKSNKNNQVSVEIERKYLTGTPHLISINYDGNNLKPINIVMSLSKVTQRFVDFLHRYKRDIIPQLLRHNNFGVRMTIAVASIEGASEQQRRDAEETVAMVTSFKRDNNDCDVTTFVTKRGFYNKGADLHEAILKSSGDEIVLVMDVDMQITWEFLQRVRQNTIKNKRVFYPVSFSQYDPDIMNEATKMDSSLVDLVNDKSQVNKQTGFWMHYAFGIVGMYRDDYLKIGGFKLDIKGWGVEDVDLYQRFIKDQDIQVLASVDSDLYHVYHKRNCDVTLENVQYERCIGAWSEMLASKEQAGVLFDGLISEKPKRN